MLQSSQYAANQHTVWTNISAFASRTRKLFHVIMEWTNEMAVKLISEYKKYPMLWNAKHPYHSSRNKKLDAWERIASEFEINVHHVKQKMNSLLGSFRREKMKGMESIGTGNGRKAIYISKWFAFEKMRFLLDKNEPHATIETDNVNNEDEEKDSESEQNSLNEEVQTLSNKEIVVEENELLQFTTPVSPRQMKRKISQKNDDSRLQGDYHISKRSVPTNELPFDDCAATYSHHLANKLRNYSKRTLAQVEHAINNILYKADMGKYDNNFPNASSQCFNDPPSALHYPINHFLSVDPTTSTPPSCPSPSPSHTCSSNSSSD